MLIRVPGVGKKTAERVMMDLKDKLGVAGLMLHPGLTHVDAEVISALTSLGYSIAEAQAALRSLPSEDLALEEKIRLVLQHLARE
jgi:Holliday junction DNA helicase RuvA